VLLYRPPSNRRLERANALTADADNALNAHDEKNSTDERALLVLHHGDEKTTSRRPKNAADEMANGLNALRRCSRNDEEADCRWRFLLPANTHAHNHPLTRSSKARADCRVGKSRPA
jgi:hypothetical protein